MSDNFIESQKSCLERKDFSPSCVIKRANKEYANEAFFVATWIPEDEKWADGTIVRTPTLNNFMHFYVEYNAPFTNLMLALREQWITRAKRASALYTHTDHYYYEKHVRGQNLKILTGRTRAAKWCLTNWKNIEQRNESQMFEHPYVTPYIVRYCELFALSKEQKLAV